MSDFSCTEESDENDYSRIKKNIQEIIKFTKNSEEDKSEDSPDGGRRKKKSSRTDSEDLFKQFVELREFQKNLAKAITSNDKENSPKPTKPQKRPPKKKRISSVERQSDSHSSLSLSSLSDKPASQSKRDRTGKSGDSPDDDDGIDGDSDLILSDDSANEATKQDVAEETDSCESSTLPKNANLSEASRRNSAQSIKSYESPSDRRADSPVVSQTELKRIKEFCRSIIIKEKQSSDRRTHSLGESLEVIESENCSISKKHDSNATAEYLTSSSRESDDTNITKITNKFNGKKNGNLSSQRNHSTPDAESHTSMDEENTKRTRSMSNNNEKTKTDDLNSEQKDFNTYGNEDQLDRSSEPIKLERINSECPSNNHLEIIPRESSEVDYLKPCKNHETEVAVKVEGGEKKLDDNPQEQTDLNQKYNLYNQSDDELMRRTVQEQVEEIMKVEVSTSTSVPEEDSFPFEDIGDGDMNRSKFSLEERIDHLQEEIQNLREQLEEAKQYNQKEAKELCYISNLYSERNAQIIRNGLEWEDWELKEMVRERLREKREAAALDYQTRLRVVEALCSAELGKLEEALETLVPLNAAASSWGSPYRPPQLRSSWMTQDYFLEVITSMNLSSSDEKSLDGTALTNAQLPPPAAEPKPE